GFGGLVRGQGQGGLCRVGGGGVGGVAGGQVIAVGGAVAGVLAVLGRVGRSLVGGVGALLRGGQGGLGGVQLRLRGGDLLLALGLGALRRGGRLVLQRAQRALGAVPPGAGLGDGLLTLLPGLLRIGVGPVQLLLGLLQGKAVGGLRVLQLGGGGLQLA